MSGAHSQSDVRALLGKQTGHLEEVLTRQKSLEQDLKRLLQFNLGQSQASRSMTGDASQEEEFDNGTLETCLVLGLQWSTSTKTWRGTPSGIACPPSSRPCLSGKDDDDGDGDDDDDGNPSKL